MTSTTTTARVGFPPCPYAQTSPAVGSSAVGAFLAPAIQAQLSFKSSFMKLMLELVCRAAPVVSPVQVWATLNLNGLSFGHSPRAVEADPVQRWATLALDGPLSHFVRPRRILAFPFQSTTAPYGRFACLFGCVLSAAPQFRLCRGLSKSEVSA